MLAEREPALADFVAATAKYDALTSSTDVQSKMSFEQREVQTLRTN